MEQKISMTVDQAIDATGIGRTKLYSAINQGKLKARKLGKRTLILRTDLEAYLNGLDEYSTRQ